MDTKLMHKKLTEKNWRAYSAIDGTKCNKEARIGYCWFEGHRGYLTVELMKEHRCLERQCKHFQKYEDALYWKQKEQNKAAKKQSREEERKQAANTDAILQKIRKHTKKDPCFYAVSIKREVVPNKKPRYIVQFISFEKISVFNYTMMLSKLCNQDIRLVAIKNTYENKIKILEAQGLL